MLTGIQISSLKPLMHTSEEVWQACEKISAMRCHDVQLQWIDKAVPVEAVARALRENGLRAVSNQDLYTQVEEDISYYLELNRACACPDLCISRIPAQYRSVDGIARFAARLSQMHTMLAGQGMTLSFHPCKPEYDEAEGTPLLSRLVDLLPAEVTLCLDLYHVARAGLSLSDTIEKFAGRISMVHFKDYEITSQGVERLMPAGQGSIDWSGVIQACERAGVRYAFVEQETWETDPFDCLSVALNWLDHECAH